MSKLFAVLLVAFTVAAVIVSAQNDAAEAPARPIVLLPSFEGCNTSVLWERDAPCVDGQTGQTGRPFARIKDTHGASKAMM